MDKLDSIINFDGNFNRIPEGWNVKPLGEFLKVQGGYAFKSEHMVDYGIPLIRISNITESGIDYSDAVYLPKKYATEHSNFLANDEDILIAMSGATTGKIAKVEKGDIPALINQRVGRFKLPNNELDCNYFYHILKTSDFNKEVTIDAVGGAQPNISGYEIESLKLLTPPLPEQRRIAEILDTVDETIRKTEQIINKLKSIKTGLLHDLLTRGIDENGNLRDPKKNPEEFRETELGRIPQKWAIKTLGEACNQNGGSILTGPFGSQLHASDYKDEGVPIITVEHLADNKIIHENLPYVGDNDYKRLQRYRLITGDLVFSRVGAIDRCAFVSKAEDGWLFSGRCLRVRVGSHKINSIFISYQLNYYDRRLWILNNAVGSTMKCLNTTILSNVPVSLPPINEQNSIVGVLEKLDGQIFSDESILKKYLSIKKGLMNDLLTGKVRVPNDEKVAV
jgi:type I restriction enzyme, S subunit